MCANSLQLTRMHNDGDKDLKQITWNDSICTQVLFLNV